MRPVLAGIWKHHETFDGTYTFEDLLDAHELLDFRDETKRRVVTAIEASRGK